MRKPVAPRRASVAAAAAAAVCCAAALVLPGCEEDSPIATADAAEAALASQAACRSLMPASQGGPMPEGDTVVIRWLGTSNYEVAFHDKVILMDTYYERPQRTRPLGFTVDQVRRADAILIGHAHSDHISDVAPVAAATRAPVVGSAITSAQAIALGVPAAQTVTVAGGETLQYGDIKVMPTHIVHSSIQPALIPALANLYAADGLRPLSAEEQAQNSAVSARGSRDPGVVALGTIGFTLVLPSGFKIVWFDSVGNPNDEELQLAKDIGPGVDVAIFPYTPHAIAETQLSYTFQHLQLFKPRLYLPDHHDHIWGLWLDNGLEPLFMKIRDELPDTKFVAPLYRSAICIDTSGVGRGRFNVRL